MIDIHMYYKEENIYDTFNSMLYRKGWKIFDAT